MAASRLERPIGGTYKNCRCLDSGIYFSSPYNDLTRDVLPITRNVGNLKAECL